MTVCVEVTVFDGVVFAADSATTTTFINASGAIEAQNVYRHGNKVFNLFKGLPIAAMTCGMASLGAPIHLIAKEFRALMRDTGSKYHIDPSNFTIEEVANKAQAYFVGECFGTITPAPLAPNSFELVVGGYSSGERFPEVWSFGIVNSSGLPVRVRRARGTTGVSWSGQPDPIQRLLMGFDSSLERGLRDAGIPDSEIPKLFDVLRQHTIAPLMYGEMPIGDAIEFTDFLVDTTKSYYRFLPGADIVSGETDMAVVTRHEGFRWIRRKHYYPAHLNPRETDHV